MGPVAERDGVKIDAVDPRPDRARLRKPKQRPWRRRAYKKVLGAVTLAFAWCLRWVPHRLVVPLGSVAGRVGGFLRRADRAQAHRNVEAALGAAGADVIVAQSFANIGATALELLGADRNPKPFLDRVTFEGTQHVEEALAVGKGVVMITGHIGNWELLAMKFTERGYPVSVIATTIRYPLLNRAMVAFRAKHGIQTIERGTVSAAKDMLRVFRKNHLLGILIDHDTRAPSVSVPFFGRPARTPVGAAELSLRTGAPAVAAFIVREGRNHRVVVHPPIFPPTEKLSGEAASQKAAEMTAEYTALIERHIARHPADWAWTHKRWRD